MPTILWLFLLSLFITWLMRNRIKERLRLIKEIDKLPGPVSIPLLGTVWQFKPTIPGFIRQMDGWAKEYTSQGVGLVRMWLGMRPIVIAFNHHYVKEILESNVLITKGPEYDILFGWLGTGLLTSTGTKWKRRRKMLTPAFHFNVLHKFIDIFNSQSRILVDIVSEENHSSPIDILAFFKRCALDIICETAMGCTVNAQRDSSQQYVQSIHQLTKLVFSYQRWPWFWIPFIWKWSGYEGNYEKHRKILQNFTLDVIRQRKEEYKLDKEMFNVKEKKAFLDLLLDMEEDEGLQEEDIREEVDTFMFEGHDTTSSAMGWTLWCVSHNQNVMKKLEEEMDRVFGESDRDCSMDDISRLTYLDKVIKESLRLYPSVPNISRNVEEDTVIGEVFIPKGCTLIISPFVLHRNPQLFSNPDSFNPLNFSEESISSRPPFSYIPFSAGPRNCIGQKFALLEEKTVLSWFFRRFRVSCNVPFEENLPCPEVITAPLFGFPMKVESRLG